MEDNFGIEFIPSESEAHSKAEEEFMIKKYHQNIPRIKNFKKGIPSLLEDGKLEEVKEILGLDNWFINNFGVNIWGSCQYTHALNMFNLLSNMSEKFKTNKLDKLFKKLETKVDISNLENSGISSHHLSFSSNSLSIKQSSKLCSEEGSCKVMYLITSS